MIKTIASALSALTLCVALSGTALAQTAPSNSSPGSIGTGQKHPETVPPAFLNAKPMPLPSVNLPATSQARLILKADDNRTTHNVRLGTAIVFKLDDVGLDSHGIWVCRGGKVHGTSLIESSGVYGAVSPGKSTVEFLCSPPYVPGQVHTNITIGYIVTINVKK